MPDFWARVKLLYVIVSTRRRAIDRGALRRAQWLSGEDGSVGSPSVFTKTLSDLRKTSKRRLDD